jgi:hypothetical protein
MARLLASPL